MSESNNTSFFKKMSGKSYNVILAGILAVTLVHFAAQMLFIQSESPLSAELVAQIENLKPDDELTVEIKQPDNQIIDIKPDEYAVRKVKVVTIPENPQPISRRQTEAAQPVQTKKKVIRETRAERLRRVERILTGV